MSKCIICREEQDCFSDEHVIPDALGGYYHIYTVCKQCNSGLGSFVDSRLVNHPFADFQRYLLGLKGKSKKLPNPFSGTHHLADNENQRVQLRLDTNGKPEPYTVTNVTYEELPGENGGTKISICVDATDEKKLDAILNKIAKKFEIPIDQLEGIDRSVTSIEQPRIKCTLSIDISEFKIGLLKIAYEFAVDTIPEYFSDKSAVEISRILKSADYDSVEKYVNIGNGFDHTLFGSMSNFLDLESKKHYLVLTSFGSSGLTCFIHLHGMFSAGVTLSTEMLSGDLIVVGINDIEAKSFQKLNVDDIANRVFSPPELRFKYYFQTDQLMQEFLSLQAEDNFDFYKNGESHPVFDKNGNQLELDLFGKMKEVESLVASEELDGGIIAHTFPFQEELFIKIIPSQTLVQVIAVREERRLISKI